MRRHRTARTGDDRGAVMVEFALVVPILLVLVVGIIEFGMAYSAQVRIQGAAREGARALALNQPDRVVAAVEGAAGGLAVDVELTRSCPSNPDPRTTEYAIVTVTADHTLRIPFLRFAPDVIEARASMRCGL